MSALLALGVGAAGYEIGRIALARSGRHPGTAGWIGLGTAALAWQPLPAVALGGAAAAVMTRRRLAARRSRDEKAQSDVPMLAELVLLGLDAGLTLSAALEAAIPDLAPVLGQEVGGVLRAARTVGLSQALREAGGKGQSLYTLVARAVGTGAPLAPAVESFVRQARHAELARRQEAARKLPVRLLVPVALLILPGFVILTVGPAVLSSLERLAL